jgi:hypothetical protein
MTFYLDIAVILCIVLAINVILVHQNVDKKITRDTYNIAIATIVISIAAILADPFGIIFASLPLALAGIIINKGPDSDTDNAEFGISIAVLCISLFYFWFSGIFFKLLDFWDLPKNIFGVR